MLTCTAQKAIRENAFAARNPEKFKIFKLLTKIVKSTADITKLKVLNCYEFRKLRLSACFAKF